MVERTVPGLRDRLKARRRFEALPEPSGDRASIRGGDTIIFTVSKSDLHPVPVKQVEENSLESRIAIVDEVLGGEFAEALSAQDLGPTMVDQNHTQSNGADNGQIESTSDNDSILPNGLKLYLRKIAEIS